MNSNITLIKHLSSSLNRILNDYIAKSNEIIKNITQSLSATGPQDGADTDAMVDSIINECNEYIRLFFNHLNQFNINLT